jgi:nucleoside 2-deoxyribosyltransferase
MSETINEFGFDWEVTSVISENMRSIHKFKNQEIGEYFITGEAFSEIKRIPDSEKFKIPALIYEQQLCGNVYSISAKGETVQWQDYEYISVNVDEFLNRFPADFIEIQHRANINLYYQCSEYGQEINCDNSYVFFAKNDSELLFFLESMKKKEWLNIDIRKMMGGGFGIANTPKITDEGWLEIEKIIKRNRKKQVFIAMKFKDMDSVYNTIYQAIDDAKFIPLRIDKKEHINQITSEIQYEISQSGLVVADATGQNQGVYFEAGYAMGLNIPVIWTCNEKEVNEIHFDIKQYNTILWKDENDLYERLKKRITAVMGLQNESR